MRLRRILLLVGLAITLLQVACVDGGDDENEAICTSELQSGQYVPGAPSDQVTLSWSLDCGEPDASEDIPQCFAQNSYEEERAEPTGSAQLSCSIALNVDAGIRASTEEHFDVQFGYEHTGEGPVLVTAQCPLTGGTCSVPESSPGPTFAPAT